jgi:hypothetical protein
MEGEYEKLKNGVEEYGLNSCGSGWGNVMDSCGKGDLPSNVSRNEGISRLLRKCQFIVKCCASGVNFIRQT